MNSTDTTILVPTSRIPEHPSTKYIDRAIESVRRELPDAPIWVMADGPLDPVYMEYIHKLTQNPEIDRVYPFPDKQQQSGMLEDVLPRVQTPLVFYHEHDQIILPGDGIDWEGICQVVKSGRMNTMRLHNNIEIHPEHRGLVGDRQILSELNFCVPVIPAKVWWMHPQVIQTEFLREVAARYMFGKKWFIEELLYQAAADHWKEFKMGIYAPEGSILRSRHLDARKGGQI